MRNNVIFCLEVERRGRGVNSKTRLILRRAFGGRDAAENFSSPNDSDVFIIRDRLRFLSAPNAIYVFIFIFLYTHIRLRRIFVFRFFFLFLNFSRFLQVVAANGVERTPKKTGKYQDAMASNKREPTGDRQSSRTSVTAAAAAAAEEREDADGKCIMPI